MCNNIYWKCYENPINIVYEFLRYVENNNEKINAIRLKLKGTKKSSYNEIPKNNRLKKNFYKYFGKRNHEKIVVYLNDYIKNLSFEDFEELTEEDASVLFVSIVRANLEQELRNRNLLSLFIENNLNIIDIKALEVVKNDIDNYFYKFRSKGYIKDDYLFWLRIGEMINSTFKNSGEFTNAK